MKDVSVEDLLRSRLNAILSSASSDGKLTTRENGTASRNACIQVWKAVSGCQLTI